MEKKKISPCSHIFFSAKTDLFLVFSMGVRPSGGKTLLDAPIEVRADEFASQIVPVLAEALRSFQDAASPDRMWRPASMSAFISRHLCVSVTRLESGDIDVVPLHHEKGGYVGKEAEHVVVPAADVSKKIGIVLRDAFAVAT